MVKKFQVSDNRDDFHHWFLVGLYFKLNRISERVWVNWWKTYEHNTYLNDQIYVGDNWGWQGIELEESLEGQQTGYKCYTN